MDSTIDRPVDSQSKQRRRAEVVAAVEELHGMGFKRDEIARELGMTPGCHGSLYAALRRAGRGDLWLATGPRTPINISRTLRRAADLLPALPAEDPAVVEERKHDLLADLYDDSAPPAGRKVRGPGGIVRWVAA